MSVMSTNEFVELLKKCGALETQQLQEVTANLDDFPTAKHLAKSLVKKKLLTEWQAKFLLSGRHRLKIGNYLLLDRLRRDEFGDRFLGLHRSLQRHVELEIFSKDVSADKTRRKALINKASLVAKLDHPGLVHVFDIDHEGDRYYLVVEHVRGRPANVVESTGLDETEIACMIKDCVSGLFHAHQRDVVHGAIIPADMIIANDGSAKLQNLSMQPLRQAGASDRVPTESDDFIALSNIGLKLLKANQSVEPHPQRDKLKQIIARLRKNPEVVAGELDVWIQQNPRRSISDAPQVTPLVTPGKSPSGSHRLRKSGAHSTVPAETIEGEEAAPGGWTSNPVRMIATVSIPVILLGLAIILGIYQWTRPAIPSQVSTSGPAKQRTADREMNRTALSEGDLSAADVDDPDKIRRIIDRQIPSADDQAGQPKPGGNRQATKGGTSVAAKPTPAKPKPTRAMPKPQGAMPKPQGSKPATAKSNNPAVTQGAKPVSAPADQAPALAKMATANPAAAGKVSGKQPAESTPQPAGKPAGNAEANVSMLAGDPAKPALENTNVANQPPVIPKAQKNTPDNLTLISGIGEKTQAKLAKVGITTYQQLASMTPADLTEVGKPFSSFGIPPDRSRKIVDQAKQLSLSNTQVTVSMNPGSAATPSKGAKTTTVAKPATASSPATSAKAATPANPFTGFPNRFRLPDSNNLDRVVLRPLVTPRTQVCSLEMMEHEGVARNRVVFEIDKRNIGRVTEWTVGLKKTAKQKRGQPIAKFFKSDEDFSFQWLEAASKTRNAESLRNCHLKLSYHGNDGAVFCLREPIKIPAIRLNPKRLYSEFEFDIEDLPNADNVRVEVVPFPEEDAELEFVSPAATVNDNARVFFRRLRDQTNDKMWFEVHADIRPRVKVNAAIMIVIGNQAPVRVKDFQDLKTLHAQLRQASSITLQKLNTKPRDTTLKSNHNKAKAEVAMMDAYMKGVQQVRKTPVKLRVVGDFGGFQTVLAVSDPELSVDEYRKNRREANRKPPIKTSPSGTKKTPATSGVDK